MITEQRVGVYKAGDIVNLTCGEYSSYEIIGTVKALQDFTDKELLAEYVREVYDVRPSREDRDEYSEWSRSRERFFSWGIRKGYFEEIDNAKEFWIDY